MNRIQDSADKDERRLELVPPAASPTRPFLEALFAELERAKVRYCVLHSWDALPDEITSDLDLVLDPYDWEKFGNVVVKLQSLGYFPIQLRNYAVNGKRIDFAWWDQGLQFAAVDCISEYRYSGVILNSAAELMTQRCWHPRGFWTTSPIAEFQYIIAKKILKLTIAGESYKRVRHLADELPRSEALGVLESMFGREHGEHVLRALLDGTFPSMLHPLRRLLRTRSRKKRPFSLIRYLVQDFFRLLGRLRKPTGLLIAVLGPDGVGKDTLISAIAQQWSIPFRFVRYFHWRPGLVCKLRHFGRVVSEPHKRPPKGRGLSLLALGSYVVDYWAASIPLAAFRSRSGLIMFNRYFHDLTVDPLRYRYAGPMWLVRACTHLIPPRERLILVLDADEGTIRGRKKELSIEELSRQRREYRQLLTQRGFLNLPANGSIEDVLENANHLIMEFLSRRFNMQYPEFAQTQTGKEC